MINGTRQPSRDGTSRMNREVQVRFREGLGVKFPGPTRQGRRSDQQGYVPFFQLPPLAPESNPLSGRRALPSRLLQ
jgi:hypothetical protein